MSVKTPVRTPAPEVLDKLSVEEIIETLNSKEHTERLMAQHDISRDALLARAEFITRRLAAGIAMVNCV